MITKTYRVKDGKTVTYTVSAPGYITQTGSVTIHSQDTPVYIDLQQSLSSYTFSISTDPANTVIINGSQRTSITALEGTTIEWSVSRTGYVTQSGTYILNSDHTEVITLVLDTVRFAIGRVTGYDNVLDTRTDITQDCTIIINGEERGFIDIVAGTQVSYTVSCNGYETYGPWYTTVNYDRTVDVELEKSTNQYTWTWSVTDINDNPLTGYEIWVNNQQIQGNSYTGTINSTCNWSCGKTGYNTQGNAHNTDNYTATTMYEDHSFNLKLVGEQTTWSISVYDGSPSGGQLSGAEVEIYQNGTYIETFTTTGVSKTYNCNIGDVFSGNVSKTGYGQQSFSDEVISTGQSMGINLVAIQPANFWIGPTPNDATVKMDGVTMPLVDTDPYGNNYYGGTFTIGDNISWEVSAPGYVTRSNDIPGIMPLSRTQTTVAVALTSAQPVTITFYAVDTNGNPINNYDVYVNGNWIGDQWVGAVGTVVNWTMRSSGYEDVSGTFTATISDEMTITMQKDVSNYLTMELTDASDELYFCAYVGTYSNFTRNIYYSTNDGRTWVKCTVHSLNSSSSSTVQTKIEATVGQRVILKYYDTNNYGGHSDNYCYFKNTKTSAPVYVYGNMASLLSTAGATPGMWGFSHIFKSLNVATKYVNGNPKILDLSDVGLATEVFYETFKNKHNLIVPPRLFKPNQTKTLYERCFYSMFNGCDAMTSMPDLPATTLASQCYMQMFQGCTSLTETAVMPNTNYPDSCFRYMFRNCSSLNRVTWLMTAGNGDSAAFFGTFSGVAANGTLYKNPSSVSQALLDAIPSGWTITDYTGS